MRRQPVCPGYPSGSLVSSSESSGQTASDSQNFPQFRRLNVDSFAGFNQRGQLDLRHAATASLSWVPLSSNNHSGRGIAVFQLSLSLHDVELIFGAQGMEARYEWFRDWEAPRRSCIRQHAEAAPASVGQ